ncbi:serine/arginine repetitive matrix protein 2-like [Macrobrachium nipponense]|uniref:serine/arginine repetitive matrix protein 2-like n=1 Tax=Macrobrachium nipponense TaxID=159736 RepID=UPI0030C8D195
MWRGVARAEVERSASIDYQHGRPSLESMPMKGSGSSDPQMRSGGSYPPDLREAITGLHTKDLYRSEMRNSVEGRYHDSRETSAGSGYLQEFKGAVDGSYSGGGSDLRNSISRSYRDGSEGSNTRMDSGHAKEPVSRPFERDLRNIISGSHSRDFRESILSAGGRNPASSKEVMSDMFSGDLRDAITRSNHRSGTSKQISYSMAIEEESSRESSHDSHLKREVKLDHHFSRESSGHMRNPESGYYAKGSDQFGKSGSSHHDSHARELKDDDYAFLAKTLKETVDPKLGWSKGSNSFAEPIGISPSRITVNEVSDYKKSYHHSDSGIPQATSYILENSALMMNMNPTPVSISSTTIKPHTVTNIGSNPQLLPAGGLGVKLQTNLYGGNDLMLLNSLQSRSQSVVSLAPVVMSTPVQIMEATTVNKAPSVTLGGTFWDSIKKEGLLSYEKNPVKMTLDSSELDATHPVGEDFQIPSFPKKRTAELKRSRSRSPPGRRDKSYKLSVSPKIRSDAKREHMSRQIRERARRDSLSPRPERMRSRTPPPDKDRGLSRRGHLQERPLHAREESPGRYRDRSPRLREISPLRLRKDHLQRSRESSPRMVRDRSPRRLRERSPHMIREVSPEMPREMGSRMQRERSRIFREASPRMIRERSPHMVREYSTHVFDERSRSIRDLSPRLERGLERGKSPPKYREMSPHHLRQRHESPPRRSRDVRRYSREHSPRIEKHFSRELSPGRTRRVSPSMLRERERVRVRERSPSRHSPGRTGYMGSHSRSPGNVRERSPARYRKLTPEHIRKYSSERSKGYSPVPVRVLPPEHYHEKYRSRSPVPVRILPPEHTRRDFKDNRKRAPQSYDRHSSESRYPPVRQTPANVGVKVAGVKEQSPYLRDIDSPPHDIQNSPHRPTGSPQVVRKGSEEDRESPRRSWDTRNRAKRKRRPRNRPRIRPRQQTDKVRDLVVVKVANSDSAASTKDTGSSLECSQNSVEGFKDNPLDFRNEASPISVGSNDDDEFGKTGDSPLFDDVSLSPRSDRAASPGTPTSDEKHKQWMENDLQRGCSPVSMSDFPIDHNSKSQPPIALERDLSPVSLDENSLDEFMGRSIRGKRSRSPLSEASRDSLIVTDSIDIQDSPLGGGDKENEDLRVKLLRIKEEKVELKLKKLEEESRETELRLQNLSPDILDYSPQRDTPSPLLDECEDDRRF